MVRTEVLVAIRVAVGHCIVDVGGTKADRLEGDARFSMFGLDNVTLLIFVLRKHQTMDKRMGQGQEL